MRVLFWFRKDLRLDDNTGLSEAVRDADGEVVPFYSSEPAILRRDDMAATRVRFALESIADLADTVAKAGSRLALDHGDANETVARAARAAEADAVYWNDEYEPSLRTRDDAVEGTLRAAGFGVRRFHDRLLAPPGAVLTRSGTPFTVFTPFQRASLSLPAARPIPAVRTLASHALPSIPLATLDELGFSTTQTRWPGGARAAHARLDQFVRERLIDYVIGRDRPDRDASSRLSADLKFGTLSARTVASAVADAAAADRRLNAPAEKYLSELRWRDFFSHVMFHHPHCERGAFRPEYDGIDWAGDERHLDAWQSGHTGYPIVDAGMRELVATGFMHNRLRMIVASFLTKDLLLDWRAGERHFMRHLVDGDLAANNGGWQWAAGTGTDAQPWFRIFNPELQGQRCDPDGTYVRRWVPELKDVPARLIHRTGAAHETAPEYPAPIVDHAVQRAQALAMYRRAVPRSSPAAG